MLLTADFFFAAVVALFGRPHVYPRLFYNNCPVILYLPSHFLAENDHLLKRGNTFSHQKKLKNQHLFSSTNLRQTYRLTHTILHITSKYPHPFINTTLYYDLVNIAPLDILIINSTHTNVIQHEWCCPT